MHFHWDRHDQSNENSSCWMRVSQAWAGKNWGSIQIPRIGQEVIVSFLEGDPDRPIITGRVYNAEQTVPYELPANATQSGTKSRSSKGGTPANFNEIRMEDKKGAEQFQQRLGDGQVIALVAQVVVRADQTQAALVDAIHTHVLASHATQAAAVKHRASGIAVLQATDLVGQARIGIAIDLGLGIGDHIQQCLGDGQVIALVVQGVIAADQAQSTLVDAVHLQTCSSVFLLQFAFFGVS